MNSILNQRYKSENGMNMMRAKMFQLQKAISKNRLRRRILEKENNKVKMDEGLNEVIPAILSAKKEDIQKIKDRYLLGNFFLFFLIILISKANEEKKPIELAEELLGMVENQMAMYEKLKKNTKLVQESKTEINDFFRRISQKIIELYKSSFDLIQLYLSLIHI